MSLWVDSRELESSHVTITFSELVAFPQAVHATPKAKNYMMGHFYATDQHNEVLKKECCELLWHDCHFYSCITYEKCTPSTYMQYLPYT